MANRSYLYSIDFNRTERTKQPGDKVFGLSEYNYSIPLAFKILVSQNSKLSKSFVWEYEHPIAIQGDFKAGRKRLLEFLETLRTRELLNPTELNEKISQTKIFLEDDSKNSTFAILECGELFEMGDDALEIQNKALYEEDVLHIEKMMNEYFQDIERINDQILMLNPNDQDSKKKIANLEQEKWELLGIDNWSEILYYHFDNAK